MFEKIQFYFNVPEELFIYTHDMSKILIENEIILIETYCVDTTKID